MLQLSHQMNVTLVKAMCQDRKERIMEIAIRYYSRGGNTKKLAEAIGDELNIRPETTDEPLQKNVDVLFLGSSVYAYGVDNNVKQFIDGIDVEVGCIYNFSTAALIKSTYSQIKKLTDAKGLSLSDKEYACKGSFGPLHKGKPGEKEIKEVRTFARKVVEDVGQSLQREENV